MKCRARYRLPLHGHLIRVEFVPGLQQSDHAEGDWCPSTHTIRIDSDLPTSRQWEVLIHECTHAVSDFMDLGLPEKKVRTLGLSLHQMLARFLPDKP